MFLHNQPCLSIRGDCMATITAKRFPLSRRALLGAFALSLALAGTAHADDLVVSAASSLTNAFQDIAKAYEAQHPDTHVVLNFASSDTLLRQIAQGAPADVFASADEATMDAAQAQHAIAANTRVDFAANELVVIVPTDAKTNVTALADLASPAFKHIAWGDPASVPAGRYTRSTLRAAGLADALAAKAVLAQNVRQSLAYVERGEVDAGFVYATDAAIAKDKVRVALHVAPTTPIAYPIAVVEHAKHAAQAQSFIDFVRSDAGRQRLAAQGFKVP